MPTQKIDLGDTFQADNIPLPLVAMEVTDTAIKDDCGRWHDKVKCVFLRPGVIFPSEKPIDTRDPLVRSAVQELEMMENEVQFPHFMDKREVDLVARLTKAEQEWQEATAALDGFRAYRKALPEKIAAQRIKIEELEETAHKRRQLGTQNKVEDLLAKALGAGVSIEDLMACLKEKSGVTV